MKPYVKPELYYENFELAQHIAGCSLELQHEDGLQCAATGTVTDGFGEEMHLDTWFINNLVCKTPLQSYCYTNGSLSHITINS